MGDLTRDEFMDLPDYGAVEEYCTFSEVSDDVDDLLDEKHVVRVDSDEFNNIVLSTIDPAFENWRSILSTLEDVETAVDGCDYAYQNDVTDEIIGFDDDDLTELKNNICERIDFLDVADEFFESEDDDDLFDDGEASGDDEEEIDDPVFVSTFFDIF